jgi:hypothetical protein
VEGTDRHDGSIVSRTDERIRKLINLAAPGAPIRFFRREQKLGDALSGVVVLVVFGLMISGLGVVAFYYALWRGLLQPLRAASGLASGTEDARRRGVILAPSIAVFGGVVTAVLIIQPLASTRLSTSLVATASPSSCG